MSKHLATDQRSGSGRIFLWLSVLAATALLGFVTATAINNNPLAVASSTGVGISKWKFIERCKEATHDAGKLTVGNGMTLEKAVAEQLQPGDKLYVHILSKPAETLENVRATGLGKWVWSAPMAVGVMRDGSEKSFGNGTASCVYDHKKKNGEVEVILQ